MSSAMADAAALVWPAPARVHLRSGRAAAPREESAETTELVLLPGSGDPRLAVPLRPRAAAAAVARTQSAAGSTRAAVRNTVLAGAFRVGVAGLVLPGRLVVTQAPGADDGLDAALSDLLGERVVVGIRVGPPRANRKPVLQVVSRRGRVLAYAKLGTNPLTDRLVEAEGVALTALAGAPLGEVRVPEVLRATHWRGHPLLVQSPLPVRRAAATAGPRLTGAMVAVARTADGGPTELARLAWWTRTTSALAALPHGDVADRLTAARSRLAVQAGDRALASAAWHGDWNSGNCSLVPGAVLVWDWERYETGVPAGFDALHLRLQTALSQGVDRTVAARTLLAGAASLVAPFGVAAADARLVAELYLLGIGVRYAADDQDRAGAAVGRLQDWLLPVLEQPDGDRPAVTAEGH